MTVSRFGPLLVIALIGCSQAPANDVKVSRVSDERVVPPAHIDAETLVVPKAYVPKIGDRIRLTLDSRYTELSTLDVPGIANPPIRKASVEKTVMTTEVLDVAANGQPTRLRRIFDQSEITRNGVITPNPLHKKAVLIEKKGDSYTFTVENGKAVEGASLAYFEGEFNGKPPATDFEYFFPAHATKVGETWDVKVRQIAFYKKAFTFDVERTIGTGRIVRVQHKDGALHATMSAEFKAPIAGKPGFPDGTFKNGSKIEHEWRAEGCIDGSSPNRTVTEVFRAVADFGNASIQNEETATRTTVLVDQMK